MSLNKFTTIQKGQDVKLNIGCDTLGVTGATTINGNVIPSGTATAGYVLENTDGAGALTWVDSSTSGTYPVSSGTYTPVITNVVTSSVSVSSWTRVGDVVQFSGACRVTLPVSGSSFSARITLPPGTTNPSNQNFAASGIGSIGLLGEPSVVNFDSVMDATLLELFCTTSDGSAFVAGPRDVIFNWSCQFLTA